MRKSYITFKFKTVVLLCLLVFVNLLTAQNTSNYKYVITPFDTGWTGNGDVLEINNRYYVLTAGLNGDRATIENISDFQDIEDIGVVTVFDEELKQIEQFSLFAADGVILSPTQFFYEEDTFYVFGAYRLPNHFPLWENCYAKFDKKFNLVQPVTTFWYNSTDSGSYLSQILKTKNNDFIIQFEDGDSSRFVYINSAGKILQDITIGFGSVSLGTILETDSNYIINSRRTNDLCLLNKDSLNIYRFVQPESKYDVFDGTAIVINNQIIRSYDHFARHEECHRDQFGFPVLEDDRSIIILDNNFKIKHYLEFGMPCAHDDYGVVGSRGGMDYINPDSIYCAYLTFKGVYPNYARYGNTISIANFSLDGKLNFNYALDLPIDSGVFRQIYFCKALSNGGVLIGGSEGDFLGFYRKSFLLYHHPTKIITNVKEYATTNTERKVFPNPAQTQFTVTNTENASLYLYNIVGQEVLNTYSTEENTNININFLPQGMYVLKVVKDKVASVHRVIKN